VNNDDKNRWYAAGLHFECHKCGRCCSGPTEGYIWVTKPEIQLIANHLNMPPEDFKRKYLSRVGFRKSIKEVPRTHDCVFLQQTSEGKRCTIYPVRPAQCRSWPFWPGNLSSPYNWNLAAQRCPGINRGPAFTPEQIQTKQNTKNWWREEKNTETHRCHCERSEAISPLIQEVTDIYQWLDNQLKGKSPACVTCGKCCDFEAYDHRLYVTTPEIMFFADKIESQNIKKMMTGRCSYQKDDKCTVYPYRFAGCRIFNCKADPDFQSYLTESVIKKFKSLCDEFDVPYRYVDLPTALKSL